jgi:hypothetical protein
MGGSLGQRGRDDRGKPRGGLGSPREGRAPALLSCWGDGSGQLGYDRGTFSFQVANVGGVAEWSKAAVLKTVDAQVSVGSNPTSSAIFLCGEVSERPKELAC